MRNRARSEDPAARESDASNALLVVEDDPVHRKLLRMILEAEGYRVQVAVHGRDALDKVVTGPPPDLILLDLRMPEMDGWAFMSELKTHAALAKIPVVVTSAAGEHVINSAPVSAGYLAKPIDRCRLLETVECCLARRSAEWWLSGRADEDEDEDESLAS